VSGVRIEITDDAVEVRLAFWQKALGLLRNISVARADVSDVRIVAEPLGEVAHTGPKIGLRLPRLYYVARTIHLDKVFVVRRGVPALCFAVRNHGALRLVLLSTPEAEALARRLGS
jgi:hypothetical protein